MRDQIIELQAVAEDWSSEQVMGWAFRSFGNRVAISSAFGAEGMVVIDLASRIGKRSSLGSFAWSPVSGSPSITRGCAGLLFPFLLSGP